VTPARPRRAFLAAFVALIALSGCRGAKPNHVAPKASPSAVSLPPPWDAGRRAPPAPEGMLWIPPGALVAGTPKGILPRIADG
jgi:hypothetical protein